MCSSDLTEISGSTTAVLLESAYFDPLTIRRMRRRLGMATEASHRFERGADYDAAATALARALELIEQMKADQDLRATPIMAVTAYAAKGELPDVFMANNMPLYVSNGWLADLTSMVEVSDRFHIKPLLRALTFPQDAYVLAVGMGAVRLIEISPDLPPHPVHVPDLPKDMASALGRRRHDGRGETSRPRGRP